MTVGLAKLNHEQLQFNSYCLVSWGSKIFLHQLICTNYQINLVEIGKLDMDKKILFATWICESIILLIDEEGTLNLLNSQEFKEANEQRNTMQAAGRKHIIYSEKLNDVAEFLEREEKKKLIESRLNINIETRELYLIIDKKIINIKIANDIECLEKLGKENEWVQFFTIANAIFHRNIREIPEIQLSRIERIEKLWKCFHAQIKNYLQFIEGNKFSPIEYQNLLLALIDFSVLTNDEKYLFGNDIIRSIDKLNLVETFMMILEPFIEKNRISCIPNGTVLHAIIKYYCKNGKNNLMQKLLFNINNETVNIDDLRVICMEHKLYIALLHLDNEPIIPFTALIKDFKLEKDEIKQKLAGYRVLWLMKYFFKRELLYLNRNVDESKWEKLTLFMLKYLVDQSHLLSFAKILDVNIIINLILFFFVDEKLAKILDRERENGLSFYEKDSENTKLSLFDRIYNIVKDLLTNDKNKEEHRYLFAFFIAKIVESGKSEIIDEKSCYDSAKFLIQGFNDFDNIIILNFKILQKATNAEKQVSIQINNSDLEERKIKIIICLLSKSLNLLADEENYQIIIKLIMFVTTSNLIALKFYLYDLKKEYEKCLALYLESGNIQIFDYFSKIIELLQKNSENMSNQISKLKNFLLQKLKHLANLNPEETKKLILNYYSNDIPEVLKYIDLNTTFAIELFEKSYEKRSNINWDKNLTFRYLKLLCENNQKKKIMKLINDNINCSLKECLDIINEFSKKYESAYSILLKENSSNLVENIFLSSISYLEFKLGGLSQALMIRFDILINFTRNRQFENDSSNEVKLTKKFEKILYFLKSYPDSQELWFIYLEKLYSFSQNLVNYPNLSTKLSKIFQKFNDHYMFKLLETNLSKDFIEDIENSSHCKLDPKLYSILIKELINYICQAKYLLEKHRIIPADVVATGINKSYQKKKLGLEVGLFCLICGKLNEFESIKVFGCSHTFHYPKCLKLNQCVICQSRELKKIDEKITESNDKKKDSNLREKVIQARVQSVTRMMHQNYEDDINSIERWTWAGRVLSNVKINLKEL